MTRRTVLLTLLAAAAIAYAVPALGTQARRQPAPQATSPVVPFVYVHTPVLDSLERWWQNTEDAREVWYCVNDFTITEVPVHTRKGTVLYRYLEVWGLIPAHMLISTPDQSLGICGKHELVIHTHPPTTCFAGRCMVGGPAADQCSPSTADLIASAQDSDTRPVAMIQCGPRHIIGYVVP